MIQSSHQFGLDASSPNLSESSFVCVDCGPRLRCANPRTVWARYASPHSPPAKPDLDKFGSSRRTKLVGLIESCTQGVGASPQECSWRLSPQTPAGAPPQTPFTRGSGGGAPSFTLGGLGAPSFILSAKPPGVWGRRPQQS